MLAALNTPRHPDSTGWARSRPLYIATRLTSSTLKDLITAADRRRRRDHDPRAVADALDAHAPASSIATSSPPTCC